MMGRLGIPEDEPIKNGLITRSLETAQKRIEGFHFDSRKHVLEFDDVLNYQRKIVYQRRREVLVGNTENVINSLHGIVGENNDAIKIISEKRNAVGDEAFGNIARGLILQTTDMFWMDHLETMDYLRSSVNLRAYGQRDPLVEYKKEGLRLFKDMQNSIAQTIIENLPAINAPLKVEEPKATVAIHPAANENGGQTKDTSSAPLVNNEEDKIGRNELCSCGSGKKYKKCHGK
jgi:preprotein translocase subunit SecA